MLEKSNPNFQLVCTMTEMPQSKREWKGETGLINQEMLSRHLIAGNRACPERSRRGAF
jgi:Na+-transporting NADH:ubiquinone oxidoreductase subunit NqrF